MPKKFMPKKLTSQLRPTVFVSQGKGHQFNFKAVWQKQAISKAIEVVLHLYLLCVKHKTEN